MSYAHSRRNLPPIPGAAQQPLPPVPPPHGNKTYDTGPRTPVGSFSSSSSTYSSSSSTYSTRAGEPVAVDFLLPTGMLITLTVYSHMTLAEIKTSLWQEARNYPLYELMKDSGFYSFVGVTKDGNKEEFVNDSQAFDRLDLFVPVISLVERQGDMDEKVLNAEIGAIIGRKLADFDLMEAEVQDCRRHWLDVSEAAVIERQVSKENFINYNYCALLVAPHVKPFNVREQFEPVIYYVDSRGTTKQLSFPVDPTAKVTELLQQVFKNVEIKKIYKRRTPEDMHRRVVLKICGTEEYLLERVELYRYKYISKCLETHQTVRLVIFPHEVITDIEFDKFIRPVHGKHQDSIDRSWNKNANPFMLSQGTLVRDSYVTTWQMRGTYQLKVMFAKNCNVSETMKVYVRAMLYHGEDPLGPCAVTMKGAIPDKAEWNEVLEFDVPIMEIPRSAKLCFVVFQKRQANKRSKNDAPIAWVNMMVFDYAGVLVTGRHTLYAWSSGDEHEVQDVVNYIGPTVLNPNHTGSLQLTVDILPTCQGGPPILFPPGRVIEDFAKQMAEGASKSANFTQYEIESLRKLIEQDPLAELTESDKELIWKMRYACLDRFPDSLPRVLQSLTWNNRSDVSQVYLLLSQWEPLHPEQAMELLDYQYADISVRKWAVHCLENFSNDQLMMFLLQLVQVLKFEPYLDCPLGEFLLRRGLKSKIIGHYLFWHLRAEMHVASVSVRYGLMLEAYSRGCGQYRTSLIAQTESLSKLKQLTGELQKVKKAKAEDLKEYLRSPHFMNAMADLRSPLSPAFIFEQLRIEKCKVMDSKMRPLWLVFDNHCKFGNNIFHIFKNGDDLRQDMLTLQVMSIMDHLWKQDGLDLRMNPYQCLSMGDHCGLIEVVLNSTTIAKIQKEQGGARKAFNNKVLYTWLKSKNPKDFDKAVENFTLSCAGCCVATYVLGIGDRHSDNIMLKENGQLVHIDFGHFLGNFKSKFGVKRERVPFVLTDDFIYIITWEKTREGEFAKFQKLCERAFLLLRTKGPLFINLFTMMLSTGIPELRTVDDIHYIRNALCLGKTEEQALEDFRKKMQEALKHSFSVSMNWFLHNVAHA